MMTAKQILEEVYGLSGFQSTGAFQGSSDPDDRMIFFLLRQAIRDVGKYKWQVLVKTAEIAIDEATLSYEMPEDFREFIPGSVRVKNDVRWVELPANFADWARVDSNLGPVGITHRLQLRQGYLTKLPQDSSSYTLRFEYISDHPVLRYTGGGDPDPAGRQLPGGLDPSLYTGKKNAEKDDDLVLLDEDLMIKAVKAKWSIEKGLDTLQMDVLAFDTYLRDLRGTDMGSKKLRFVSEPTYYPASPYTNTWK